VKIPPTITLQMYKKVRDFLVFKTLDVGQSLEKLIALLGNIVHCLVDVHILEYEWTLVLRVCTP
jgi:hypothetical protein